MLHVHGPRRWIASAWLLAGCNIDGLASEFQVAEPSGGTTASSSSSGEAGQSSGSTSGTGSTSTSGASVGDGETTSGTGETSGHGTSDTTSSSTGSPPAICGDGEVADGEECDDGNSEDRDACDNSCARSWTLFVTSEFMYSGNLSGLDGADTRCRHQAALAGLPQALSYRALISDSSTDAADRLHHARGWFRLVNGLPVAHGWQALVSGTLENPVNVTENSETANVSVWTGTMAGGVAVPGAEHCMDWKSESSLVKGHWGRSSEVDAAWLRYPSQETNPTPCLVGSRALYCVEQP
jgi:cysteine-rich repeat protein